MQAYFEPKQAFSITMLQPVFEISIAYKKNMYLLILKANANGNFKYFKAKGFTEIRNNQKMISTKISLLPC